MEAKGRIQSVDRAIRILQSFSLENKELKLTDIADRLDLNKSTVHGIISTLKYHGLIDQDEETQKYRLGLYLMELADLVARSIDVLDITTPVIQDVSKQLDETIHIGMLDGSDVVYINKEESNQSMRIYTTIGARNPAYCTGVGKAMLAYQDFEGLKDRIPDKLEPLTKNTITSREALLEDLSKIKVQGYAMDYEENVEGLTCIAAPIFNHKGEGIYGISVSGPTVRMTEEKIKLSKEVIKKAAEEISRSLGYRG